MKSSLTIKIYLSTFRWKSNRSLPGFALGYRVQSNHLRTPYARICSWASGLTHIGMELVKLNDISLPSLFVLETWCRSAGCRSRVRIPVGRLCRNGSRRGACLWSWLYFRFSQIFWTKLIETSSVVFFFLMTICDVVIWISGCDYYVNDIESELLLWWPYPAVL